MKSVLSANCNLYFDREQVWEALSNGERMRIEETLEMLPGDIRTILNVGCGDGRVTRSIKGDYNIFGVDLSMTAARLFHSEVFVGSTGTLPCRDSAFDLVLATELLEHLPSGVFEEALKELKRVAARYLLITVPNNEVLEANHLKCHCCGAIYHAWTHLRRFSGKDLETLVEGFQLENLRPVGFWVPVLFRWPYRLLNKLGDTWGSSSQALCPDCGVPAQVNLPGNRFGWLWQKVVWQLYERPLWRKKAFLGALYRRVK